MTYEFNIVILGILLSIIFYEITNISPGGIIVPGLMALYIRSPEKIVFTVIVALIAHLLVKLASKYLIIFGRRRFVLLILTSLFVSLIFEFIFKLSAFNILNVSLIGYTLAGILANDFAKQGIKKTLPAFIIVLMMTVLVYVVFTNFKV